MLVRFQHILNYVELRGKAGWLSFSSRCGYTWSMICRAWPGDYAWGHNHKNMITTTNIY